MAATQQDIRKWLTCIKDGSYILSREDAKATHVIIMCDDFDFSDYPVPVYEDQDVNEVLEEKRAGSMQRVMEVYSLNRDIEEQLAEHRAFHLD